MHDVFEPRFEPARSVYLSFQEEAAKRHGRTVEEWMAAEIQAVYQEALKQAVALGLRALTLAEIQAAQRSASGHVDYGAQWAYRISDLMHKTSAKKP